MNPNKKSSIPIIAIVGTPNVGKSSLFNRLIGKRKAIVEAVAGITRNRLFADLALRNHKIRLVDTGGIKTDSKKKIDLLVYKQVEETLKEADVIFFVTDVKMGATSVDYHIASLLRKSSKKVFLLVNKVDSRELEQGVYDFYQLGMGQPYSVSATNGHGLDEVLKDLGASLFSKEKSPAKVEEPKKETINITVVGRPNVGKSSYINALFQKDIVIVDDVAGTTRDSIDLHFEYDGKIFILVDTAGMKHKRKLRETVEMFSLARTKESIRKAEVALVILDAVEGLCVDDIKVIEYVRKCGKPCTIMVNKWDLIEDVKQQEYEKDLKIRLKLLESVPIIFTSCVTNKNLLSGIELASVLKEKANINVKTAELNKILQEAQKAQRHPIVRGKRVNIYYATQTRIAPPTFTLFCNFPKSMKPHYLNFLSNRIRSHFDLFGVPIRFDVREK